MKAGPIALDVPSVRSESPGVANVLHFNNAGAALPPRPVPDSVVSHPSVNSRSMCGRSVATCYRPRAASTCVGPEAWASCMCGATPSGGSGRRFAKTGKRQACMRSTCPRADWRRSFAPACIATTMNSRWSVSCGPWRASRGSIHYRNSSTSNRSSRKRPSDVARKRPSARST